MNDRHHGGRYIVGKDGTRRRAEPGTPEHDEYPAAKIATDKDGAAPHTATMGQGDAAADPHAPKPAAPAPSPAKSKEA